jgi:phage baseplate assembly protein W
MPESDFLGNGLSLPIAANADGQMAMIAGERNIRQSIWIILATSPGERVMRPDFGCGIHEQVFAVNDALTAGEIMHQVRDALIRWEPRIDVLDVDVTSRGRNEEVLLINIHYRVRTTNNFFNLVYPFYLAGAQQ